MNELLITTTEQGSLVVSSLDFAAGLDIQHKNLLETIRAHKEAIEEGFGLIAFQTEPVKDSAFETRNLQGGKRSTKPITVAYLTEDQALFVGTLSRNSKRVVEFKSTLVRSFSEARRRQQPATLTTEQLLIQLAHQQTQLLTSQQEQLNELRRDVEQIMTTGHRPAPAAAPHQRPGKQLSLPGIVAPPRPTRRGGPSLRQTIAHQVNEYCGHRGYEQSETYNYLYKRMFDVYGVNVYRHIRQPGESYLDALERYGHLDRLYSLIMAELTYSEDQ